MIHCWKWKWSCSVVSDSLRPPWTAAYQAPQSMEFSRQEYWSGLPFSFSRGSSQPRDRTRVSHILGRCFNFWATMEAHVQYHVICKQWELYFFFSDLDSFYFFFFSAVARTSQTMLNNSGESGHPYVVPDLRENAFSFSPLRIMFAVGLSYIAFTMVR